MERLNMQVLGRLQVSVPPLAEQDAIRADAESSTARIRGAMGASRRLIALIGEARLRLIADVMTGKLDVLGAAVRPTEEAEA